MTVRFILWDIATGRAIANLTHQAPFVLFACSMRGDSSL